MLTGPTTPHLPSLEELNHLPRTEFATALEPLFEASGPLADALHAQRPYASYDELLNHAVAIVERLSEPQKIEVINAHPRIGAPPDTLRATSMISYREQGYDRPSGAEQPELELNRRLAELNAAYEQRFGFRFVVFVNRRPRSEILEILKQRFKNARNQEMDTALRDMLAIARDRLRSLQAG